MNRGSTGVLLSREPGPNRGNVGKVRTQFIFYEMCPGASRFTGCLASGWTVATSAQWEWGLRVKLVPRETGLSPPVKYFTDRSEAVLLCIIYVISVLFLLCFRARLFAALWSPAGKGLTSWLSFIMYNCEVVTFPLVTWVTCGAWLYRFLVFALFLTLLCWV